MTNLPDDEGLAGLDLAAVARVWGLPNPVTAAVLPAGTNNLILRLHTGDIGDTSDAPSAGSRILRVYRNTADPARVAFEGEVLRRLGVLDLPFAVPAPLPTVRGAYVATLPVRAGNEEGTVLAVLEPYLPGAHPDGGDLALAEDAGTCLALLDRALAEVGADLPASAVTWRSYGDLEHCHPLVPAPREAIAALPLADEVRTRLLAAYDVLMAEIPALYATLPQQLTHEDVAPSNTLARDSHLSAILDFEFCSRDVRAMDLTVALSWWPGDRFGSGEEWPILRALARGYGSVTRLSGAEIRAIPTLYLLRAYTSLIHRLGRHRQGLSPLAAVLDRATAALEREDWLRAYGDRLLALLDTEVGEG